MAEAKRDKLIGDIERLKELDAALREGGASVRGLAEQWQTTPRAIQRYLDVLRQLVGPTEAERYDDNHFRQTYVGKPKRLFAK